jgi:hypothetical protein
MATSPSECAGTLASEPLNAPTGVRAALTMTISLSFIPISTCQSPACLYPDVTLFYDVKLCSRTEAVMPLIAAIPSRSASMEDG